MSEQICRFCHRYVQLAYYCEECGISCCSDCLHEDHVDYYTCQDCSSRKIGNTSSDNEKMCKDCGSENVVKISQLIKSCPKCNSHQIVNIYEKKEDLEKRFLELIKNTRLYVEPLREILNKLFMLQQKLKEARDPPFKYYHYPKMESDLLALFKLFQHVQSTLYEKISVHFHQLNQNKEYFFDTYTQPNSNITIIEGIFENLIRSYGSINEFISNNINTFNQSIDLILANLQFIDKLHIYFNSYKKLLNLAEKEKPVFAIYAKLSNGLDTQERYKKNKGLLFITNFDLSFVHEHGFIKKKKELIFKAPVGDLIRIKEKGKVFKKLYIEFSYGKYEFSLPPKSVSKVIEYILLARTFDETTVYDEKTALKLQRINIDLSDLDTFIEESINSFFSLKCQYNKSNEKGHNFNQSNMNQNLQSHPNRMQDVWHNDHFNSNYNNTNFPGSMENYPRYNNSPPIQPSGNYPPETSNQFIPLRYDEQAFFMQNFSTPNRLQNYDPRRFLRYSPEFSNFNNRNYFMRKNMQNQNPNNRFINQFNNMNRNEFNKDDNFFNDDPNFQDYNKNHLSDLFKSSRASPRKSYGYARKAYRFDKKNQEEMLELKKELYSLNQTLKKLDTKFDQGIISEVDYFKTYKNLQKEIYLIDNKIKTLKGTLEDQDL